jgi:hypothetical protein
MRIKMRVDGRKTHGASIDNRNGNKLIIQPDCQLLSITAAIGQEHSIALKIEFTRSLAQTSLVPMQIE